MKYSKLITTAGAALVALAVAAPAFADEAAASVNASANASANAGGGHILISNIRIGTGTPPAAGMHGDASASANARMNGENRIEKGQALGKAEIEKRIQSLKQLSDRIGSMKRLSADQIAQIQASINAEIDILTNLETTIGNDTSTTTLKADVQSIAKANRVYLLVMPQAQIVAASDRILAAAGQLANLSTKLSARIDAAQTAGKDVSALSAALTDMNAKVADAKTQANAAAALVVNLKADNGDDSVKASNTATLKDARTKLEAARAAIQAAFKDAQTIIAGVKGTGDANVNASVHADATANANAHDE